MPIPAATGNMLSGSAGITGIHNGPERTASAIADIFHGIFMDSGHSVAIKFQILLAINPEDLLNGTHDNTPCIT
jgi:hypothetical protein